MTAPSSRPSRWIPAAEIFRLVRPDTQIVAIDEAQFLDPDIVTVATLLASRGVRVILAGTDTDFRGEPFGSMGELMAVAEVVDKLQAICVVCGDPACRNQRLIDGKPARYDSPTIMIGGRESYEARCRHCHKVPRRDEDQRQCLVSRVAGRSLAWIGDSGNKELFSISTLRHIVRGHDRGTREVGDFRKLQVWKAAQELAVSVYRCTASFPKSERYGLTSQMRHAAASIGANLAEGCGRWSDAELRRFARISLGSATELESHLLLARELGFLDAATFESLDTALHRVQGGLVRLIRWLHPSSR